MTRTMVIFVALAVLLAGCSAKPNLGDEIPDEADSLTLFSIDGTESWKGKTTGETLYGCPVVGSVEITEPAQRREVLAAVKNAIRTAKETPKPCWMPRHVLRVATRGKILDVVVCFECRTYRSYWSEMESTLAGGGRISLEAQGLLNDILAKAGIPVVPNLSP